MDITDRLRRWTHAVDAPPASDLMDEAAAEIERLRALADKRGEIAVDRRREIERLRGYRDEAESDAAVARLLVDRLRLTDAERAAIDRARRAFRDMDHNDMTMQQVEDYEVLCGLLERHGALGGGDGRE